MTKKQQNNHPGTGYLTEIRTMISGLRVISGSYCGLLLKNYLCHGASGIARRKKRPSSVADVLLPIIAIRTLIGSNARNLAVRSMVMMIETLRLPLSVIIFLDVFNSFFVFIFSERIFKSIREFCLELRVRIFKLFDAFLKFKVNNNIQ